MLEYTRSTNSQSYTKGWLKYQCHKNSNGQHRLPQKNVQLNLHQQVARQHIHIRGCLKKRRSTKRKGGVQYCLITQLRVHCVCAQWVSLLADRNIDRVLYTCWQLTDQLAPLRETSQPPPKALPPFTSTRFATTRMVRNSQQCIFLSFCKPLVCPNFDSLHW